MRSLMLCCLIIVMLLNLRAPITAQTMSREEASVIARTLCDLIGLAEYPLGWQATKELPTPVEVPKYDQDLQDALALAGYNPQPTLYPHLDALRLVSTPYDEMSYIYWCSNYMVAVNAYSGKVTAEWQGNFPKDTFALPAEQLEAIARQFVQTFFGNRPWKWTITIIPEDPESLFADFAALTFDPSSNAYLLDFVGITLSVVTGELLDITVYQHKVNISTQPKITRDEAWVIAQAEIRTAYPKATITRTEDPPHSLPLRLVVFEDSLRQQFLAWELYYIVTQGNTPIFGRIWVDAHTGGVLHKDEVIHMGSEGVLNNYRIFEGSRLLVNGKQINFGRRLLLRNGRVYLWEGYLPFFRVDLQGNRLVAWDRKVSLAKANLMEFQGKRYVTLRDVCAVAGIRLWWDNERKVPILRAEWLEAKRLLVRRANLVQ